MADWIKHDLPAFVYRGVDPADLVASLARAAGFRGWRLVKPTRWPFSWADPFTRCIRLRSWRSKSWADRAFLLAHEFTHVRQFDGPWHRRWWRAFRYFTSARVRLAMEVEAKAHALAAILATWWAEGAPRPTPYADAGALADFKSPYFLFEVRGDVEKVINDRVDELLDALEVEKS